MKDVIRINGMSFYGYHGVSAAEKETGRVFEVDCEVAVDLAEAGKSDRLNDTIDYEKIYKCIRGSVEDKAFSLLEGLATELTKKILDNFPVYRVTLKVRKLNPPIAGQIRNIEVEITRQQTDPAKLLNDTHEGK